VVVCENIDVTSGIVEVVSILLGTSLAGDIPLMSAGLDSLGATELA
jgi:hypothetical protein